MRKSYSRYGAVGIACLVAAAAAGTAVLASEAENVDWPVYGLNSDEQRFSALQQINDHRSFGTCVELGSRSLRT
jgi:hypothetical protein